MYDQMYTHLTHLDKFQARVALLLYLVRSIVKCGNHSKQARINLSRQVLVRTGLTGLVNCNKFTLSDLMEYRESI